MTAPRDLLQLDAPTALKAAWQWWVAELRDAMPNWLHRALRPSEDRHILSLDQRGALVVPGNSIESRPAAARSPARGFRGALSRLVAAGRRSARVDAVLRLDDGHLFVTSTEFPTVPEAVLAPIVRNEIDRITPFGADQVFIGQRVVGHDPLTNRSRVEVIIATRTVVRRAMELADAAGAHIVEVLGVSPDGSIIPLENIEQGSKRKSWQRFARPSARRGLLVAGLVAAVWASLIVRSYRAADALEQKADALHRQAMQVSSIETKIDAYQKQIKFLVSHRQQNPVTPVFDSLAELLPADTFLTRLAIDSNSITVEGMSGSSSELPVLLSKSPYLEQPRLVGPLTHDKQASGEHFSVTAALHPPKKP